MSRAREPISQELRLSQLWKIVERLARETAKAAVGLHQETHQAGNVDSLIGLLDANARVGVRSIGSAYDEEILAISALRGYWILDDPYPTTSPTTMFLAAAAAPGFGSRLRLLDTSGSFDPIHQVAAPSGFSPTETTYYLGNQRQAGTPGTNCAENSIRMVRVHVPHSGTVSTLQVYLDGSGPGSGAQTCKALVYTDDGGGTPRPSTLLATSSEVTVSDAQAAAAVTFTFGSAVSVDANTYVWVGLIFGANTNTIRLFAPASGGEGARTLTTGVSYTLGAPTVWDSANDVSGSASVSFAHLVATPSGSFGLRFNGPGTSTDGSEPQAESVEHVAGDASSLNWLGSWTVGGWFLFDSLPTGSGQDLFHGLMGSNTSPSASDAGGGLFVGHDGKLYVWRSDGSTGAAPATTWNGATDRFASTDTGAVTTGQWYFIVGTASDGELALWVDGEKVASIDPYNIATSRTRAVRVGELSRKVGVSDRQCYLKGRAHRVFIAQTQVTDAAQIAALFEAGSVGSFTDTLKRRRLNLIPTDGISVSIEDDATDEEVDITIGLDSVLDAVALTRVRKNSTGNVVARHRLNLIEGNNVRLTLADDEISDEADITIDALGAGTSAFGTVSVKKNSGSIVSRRHVLNFQEGDNVTLTVTDDTVANEAQILIAASAGGGGAGTAAFGTVNVRKNGVDVGRRHNLNFVEGDNVTLTVTDDGDADNEVRVRIDASGGGGGGGGTAAFGTVNVRKNGVDVGRRHNLNFIEGSGITLTIADDGDADNEVDIEIASTGGAGGGFTVVADSGDWPSSPSAGDAVLVRGSTTPFNFLFMVFDSTYNKWISEEFWLGSHRADNSMAVTTTSFASFETLGSIVPLVLTYKPYKDVGVDVEYRLVGAFTANTNANLITRIAATSFDAGDAAFGQDPTKTEDAASEFTVSAASNAMRDTGWLAEVAGLSNKAYIWVSGRSKISTTGASTTGTIRHIRLGVRFVRDG